MCLLLSHASSAVACSPVSHTTTKIFAVGLPDPDLADALAASLPLIQLLTLQPVLALAALADLRDCLADCHDAVRRLGRLAVVTQRLGIPQLLLAQLQLA